MKRSLFFVALLLIFKGYGQSNCQASFTHKINLNGAFANTINFQNTSTNSSAATTYLWKFSDGKTSTEKNPIHIFHGKGVYNICLTLTDPVNNCTSTFCDTVMTQKEACPFQEFTIRPYVAGTDPKTIYIDSILVDPLTHYTYSWDFGDGTISYNLYPMSHTYVNSGRYAIRLNAMSSDSVCGSGFIRIIYTSTCKSSFTYSLDSTTNIYQFNAETNGVNYLWDFGDGTTSTLQNPKHVFLSDHTFAVTLEVSSPSDSLCHSLSLKYLDVKNTKPCAAFFSIEDDSTSVDPTALIVYNYATDDLNYHWDFGDGTSSNLKNPVHTYSGNGPYFLCVNTWTADSSCFDTYCDSIGKGLPGASIKVIDKRKATGIVITDLHKNTLENYPNPFSSSTIINYTINSPAQIELTAYDLLGNKLEVIESGSKGTGSYSKEWAPQHLKKGLYVLQLKINNYSITKKIILTD